jgi:hypothetical protein
LIVGIALHGLKASFVLKRKEMLNGVTTKMSLKEISYSYLQKGLISILLAEA